MVQGFEGARVRRADTFLEPLAPRTLEPLNGIVRARRRPAGWVAPGPPPAYGADSRAELQPRTGEDLCYLSGDWRILQRIGGHRWSLDDLVTAWVAVDETRDAPPRRYADLGCGIGSVLMMLAWRFPQARGLGVEAQAVSADLARRSLAWNGILDRCAVRLGDLRNPSILPEARAFALVTGTPPYLAPGTANESKRLQRGPCRFEHRGGIEAYCRAAARLLAPGGIFVACAGALQRERVATAADRAGLAINRRLDVVPRADKSPLFSVYAMRAEPTRLSARVDAFIVRGADGERTAPFRTLREEMGMPP
jgi:tRNA1Val (adenine37-N6)-methyltransferase